MAIEYRFPITNGTLLPFTVTDEIDPIKLWRRSDLITNEISISASGRNMRNKHKKSSSFVNIFLTLLDYRLPKKLRKDPPVIIILCDKNTGIPYDVVIQGQNSIIWKDERYRLSPGEIYKMIMEVQENYGGGGQILHIHKLDAFPLITDILKREIETYFGAA